MRTLLFLSFFLVALPCVARAQETGGSFGGGSFGGGGGGGGGFGGGGGSFGGGGGSFGGGGGSFGGGGGFGGGGLSGGSSSWSSSGSSSSGLPADPGLVFVAVIVIIVVLVLREAGRRDERRRSLQSMHALLGSVGPVAPMGAAVDVTSISLAVDWRARRFLQAMLAKLAREGDTKTNIGLARLLAQCARSLMSVESAWLYGAALNASPMRATDAQRAFTTAVDDARARFKREIVRSENGVRSESDAGPLRARPTEGEGVVVVTIVAAARRELRDIRSVRDARELKALLAQLAALGSDLVAMEVVWSPAAEDDRMSSAELEALYPDLIKLDESSLVGRVFCAYCHGPYPRELGTCPHCGAPA